MAHPRTPQHVPHLPTRLAVLTAAFVTSGWATASGQGPAEGFVKIIKMLATGEAYVVVEGIATGRIGAPVAPPGPRARYPGELLTRLSSRDRLAFLTSLPARFGDVSSFRAGGRRIVVLRHPDDIRDVLGDVASLGKPAGQDVLNARPSSAQALGLEGAIQHFDVLIAKAGESIPACNARDMLRQLVLLESERLVPKSMCDGYRKRTGKVKSVKAEKAPKSVKLPAASSKSFNAPR